MDGGARFCALRGYCVCGSVANWSVREPSDQRRTRAFESSLVESVGLARCRSVVKATLRAEKSSSGFAGMVRVLRRFEGGAVEWFGLYGEEFRELHEIYL